ncbi:MAG TPA: hypothetical protein VIP78_04660 [Candidatus Dormibacteraeota bacterium]|jgi:hypothetical protein
MAKDLGQHDRVHPPVERPGCIAVTQQVRIDTLPDPGLLAEVAEELLDP